MKKLGAACCGCLTGGITLILGVIAISYISSALYNAPFYYKELQCVPSPKVRKYAYLFNNTNKRNSRTPYSGVCVTHSDRLARDYESEIFSISPTNALSEMQLIWIDENALEIKFRVNQSVKAHIHYGRPPSGLLREIKFTELDEPRELIEVPTSTTEREL